MRSIGHWSPKYLWNRLALARDQRRNPDRPWLTRAMVEFLTTWLQREDVGLEFGSGRSTVWFSSRVRYLTSVEHDPRWYAVVSEQLRSKIPDAKDRVNYLLYEDGLKNLASTEYVRVADRIKAGTLDFCLVDGMARDHCAFVCMEKLKPGGVLIIDNANWYMPRVRPSPAPNSRSIIDGYASDVWRAVGEKLRRWREVWTTDGVTDTALWVRPPT